MRKRLICIGVILGMLFPSITAMADDTGVNYTPGDKTQIIEISSEGLNLEANKEQVFDIVLGFDAMSLTVLYEAANDTNLILKTDMGENFLTLSAAAGEGTINISPELRYGAQSVSLISDKNIKINSLTFNKVNYYSMSSRMTQIVALSDYEKAMEDVVVVGTDKSALKVNGALRYIDYDDTKKSAKLVDSKIYIPVKTFARAFSLYYDDYNDFKNFVYLSNDSFELYCSSHNGSYYTFNGKKESIKNPVVYVDGFAYLPIRYVAELMGKTVAYRDGLAVVGNKINAQNVINNDTIFAELKSEISDFAVSKAASGKVYYVSQEYGDDNNTGSEALPFKTIQKAASKATAGDAVIIKEGVYRETVTPVNNGTKSLPVIYKAAEGENVVISAMNTVSGFTKYSGAIYYAPIPKGLDAGRNFVAIKNEAVIEGRHPNSDTHTIAKMYNTNDTDFERKLYPTVGDLIVTQEDTSKNRFTLSSTNDLTQEDNFWKGAAVVAMHAGGWTLSTGEVIESTQGSVVVKDVAPEKYGFTYFTKEAYPADFGYITNHLNTVDTYGEWYVDKAQNLIYMIPPQGTNGENLEIELKQRQTVIDLTGKSYIQFKDINTFGGGITMKDSTMCVINGGEHKYISHFTYNTNPHTGALGTTNDDTDGPQTKGEIGEYISGKNNAFVNATVHGSAGAGIYVTGAYNYIENNTVLNTDYAGIYPSGITLEVERWYMDNIVRGGHSVISNTVKYAGRACFYNSQNYRTVNGASVVYPTVANDIAYNEFGRGCIISRDGGVVYEHGVVGGNDTKQSTLHHNVVYDHIIQPASENYSFYKGIYRDAHVVFEKCYSNIYLNTDENSSFAGKIDTEAKAYYIQNAATGASYVEDYNNVFLGYRQKGQDSLSVSDYPNGRMFLAGAGNESRFLHNIEETSAAKTIFAQDLILENNASMRNGSLIIQSSGESAVTDNIEVASGPKQVRVSYTGDKYDVSVYCLELDVIKDNKVIYTQSEYVSYGGSRPDDIVEKVFYIPDGVITGGEIKLRLRVKDSNQLTFSKLVIDDYTGVIPEKVFPAGSKIIMAGTGTILSSDTTLQYMRPVKCTDEFRNYSIAKIGNTSLAYTVTTDEVNAVQVMLLTSSVHSNGTLSIYADDEDTPLCVIDVNEEYLKCYPEQTEWLRLKINKEFSKTLPKGEHTFRFVFKRKTASSLFTPDFNNMALYYKAD